MKETLTAAAVILWLIGTDQNNPQYGRGFGNIHLYHPENNRFAQISLVDNQAASMDFEKSDVYYCVAQWAEDSKPKPSLGHG